MATPKPFSTSQLTRDALDLHQQKMLKGSAKRIHEMRHARYPSSIPTGGTAGALSVPRSSAPYQLGLLGKQAAKRVGGPLGYLGVPYEMEGMPLEDAILKHQSENPYSFIPEHEEKLKRLFLAMEENTPGLGVEYATNFKKILRQAKEKEASPYFLLPFQDKWVDPYVNRTVNIEGEEYYAPEHLSEGDVLAAPIEEKKMWRKVSDGPTAFADKFNHFVKYIEDGLQIEYPEPEDRSKVMSLLQAAPDAQATALSELLPQEQQVSREDAPESTVGEMAVGMGAAIPLILGPAAAGAKMGAKFGGRLGALGGGFIGGTAGAAEAGWQLAKAYLELDPTEEQSQKAQEAFWSVFLNPIASRNSPERKTLEQVLPDNPYLRSMLEFTAFDPAAEALGFGVVNPLISRSYRRLVKKQPFFTRNIEKRTPEAMQGAKWLNSSGEFVDDPAQAVMTRAPMGPLMQESGPMGWKYGRINPETGQLAEGHYVDPEGLSDYMAELAGGLNREGALSPENTKDYWKMLYESSGRSKRSVGDVLNMSDVHKKFPSVLNKQVDELVAPEVRDQAVSSMAEEDPLMEIAAELEPLIREYGGITYDVDLRASPEVGFSVAPFKDTEAILKPAELTPDSIRNHLEKWKPFYEHEGMHFGAWYDKKEGQYVLDASIVVDDKLKASAIAKSGNQDAIFDLSTFTEGKTSDLEGFYGKEYFDEAVSEWDGSKLKTALQQTKDRILGRVQRKSSGLLVKKGVPKTSRVGELDNEFAVKSARGKIDNIHIFTENLEGKGGVIMERIIRPALYGGKYGTRSKRTGEGEGQFAYDKAVYNKLKELTGLLRKAGIGNFYEPKNPLARRAQKIGRVFVRGGAKSEERSARIVEAIENNNYTDLNSQEQAVADWLVRNLDDYINDINKVRSKMGHKVPLVLPRKNYFPHVFTMSFFDGLYGDLYQMSDSSIKALNRFMGETDGKGVLPELPELSRTAFQRHLKEVSPYNTFPSTIPWLGNLMERDANIGGWSRNIMTAMERYVEGAERIKKMSIPAARAQEFFDLLAEEGKISSEVKEVYDDWIQEGLLGRISSNDRTWLDVKTFRGLNKLTGRIAANLITGSATFLINNLSAIPALSSQGIGLGSVAKGLGKTMFKDFRPIMGQVFDELPDSVILRNIKNTTRALGFTANNFGIGHAVQKSKVLQNRVHTGYENLGKEALKAGSVSKLLIGVMNSGDQFAVATAFNSAYNAGIRSGLTEAAAVEFADDIAMKTQAVYGRAFMSKLSRSKVFQTVLPFQTWVMQQQSWVRDNILGKGTARLQFDAMTPAQRLGTTMKYAGMAFAINSVYQSMGLPAPWDLGSVIPGWDQLKIAFGERPNRDANLLAAKPMVDLWFGLSDIHDYGFDMNRPAQRRAAEAGLLVFPPKGGLQMSRTLGGLFDVERGYTTTGRGRGIRLDTEDPLEVATAVTLGPRRTSSYLRGKDAYAESVLDRAGHTLFPKIGLPIPGMGTEKFEADFGLLNPVLGIEENK
jgi:hypothetical protein